MEANLVSLVSTYVPFLKDNQWDVHIAQGFDASLVCISGFERLLSNQSDLA